MARLSSLPFILAAVALPMAGAASAQPARGMMMEHMAMMQAPVVSLSVTGSVESAPDMATVGTGVQTRAMTAKEAMRLNAVKMEALIAAILKSGVDRKDVQTSGINLSPQYDYSNRTEAQGPRFIGYDASNQLTVKIRKIADTGDIIDRMVSAGATNISGPSFGIADDTTLLRQAREKAIRSARERAAFYAQQAGYRDVRLISISETGDVGRPYPVPMLMMRAEAADAKTQVEPGQLSTSVTLNFQYALEK